MSAANSRSWPHTRAYIESLPDGLDSHPTTSTRGSVLAAFRAHLHLDAIDEMPEDLAALVRYPPVPSRWLPTVHVNVAEMMLVDQLGGVPAFDELAYQVNSNYLRSPLYRAAFRVLSPQVLLRGAAFRWRHFHRGSSLKVTHMDGQSGRLHLTYAESLFNGAIAGEKGGAFRVALELAGARDIEMACHQPNAHEAIYDANWRPRRDQ